VPSPLHVYVVGMLPPALNASLVTVSVPAADDETGGVLPEPHAVRSNPASRSPNGRITPLFRGRNDRVTRPHDDRSVARTTAIVIGLVLLTVLGLLLVYEVRRVIVWIVIAAFFATALHPLVSWFERRVRWVRRWLATLVVFVVVFVVLTGLVALFVVPLVREGTQLAQQLPDLISDARAGRGPVGELLQRFHVVTWIQEHSTQIQSYASGVGGSTLTFVKGAATTIAGIVTIFVLSYLMVLEV